MLATSWSIALLVCSMATLFLIFHATATAIRILLFWNPDSDSERQINLEGRVWLAAALIETGLGIQILSLLLLVMAADAFSSMIAGAMCATGSFLANEYGSISLFFKICGIFLCGIWIVLHRLDLQSEKYPLLVLKFWYILLLAPFLAMDSYYLFQYLYHLEPDIITSCCGVLFSDAALQTNFFLPPIPAESIVAFFYLLTSLLLLLGLYLMRQHRKTANNPPALQYVIFGSGHLLFFTISLVTLTTFFSSYIYAMPYHNCPFDILKKEYGFIGYPIYLALFSSSFAGISTAVVSPLSQRADLTVPVNTYQRVAVTIATVMLLLYTTLVSFFYIRYMLAGGEV